VMNARYSRQRFRPNRSRRLRAAVALGALALCGCGAPKEVEVAAPRIGAIRESFSEPARTRLARTHRIAMPVAGRIGRIDLEPGDAVQAGQTLAEFDLTPFEQAVAEARAAVGQFEAQVAVKDDNRLENTALIEANAVIEAGADSLRAADQQVDAETARSDRASKELTRNEKLADEKTIAQTELDDARLLAETSLIELRKQQFYRSALNAMYVAMNLGPRYIEEWLGRKKLERVGLVEQLAQARARLALAEHNSSLAHLQSPIDGVVLERYEQGDSPLPAGQSLLLLGNLDELEVIVDVLTQDALRLSPGSEVQLQPATRFQAFPGQVKRIEPAGFTKLSSLGVEQQRVNVIVSLDERPEGLGVGYRLQAQFFTGSNAEALIVPRFSVLQAPDQSFYVFTVRDGKLKRRPVRLGLRSDLELEIVEGLKAEETIVASPEATMHEEMKVKAAENH
jgi:HlyD family secretion protein